MVFVICMKWSESLAAELQLKSSFSDITLQLSTHFVSTSRAQYQFGNAMFMAYGSLSRFAYNLVSPAWGCDTVLRRRKKMQRFFLFGVNT